MDERGHSADANGRPRHDENLHGVWRLGGLNQNASGYTDRTPTLRFTPFAIDVQRHVLMRGGEPVALSPRLVDLLGHLASHPNQVITKEALLDRFWPDVHVSDNVLTWSMNQVRKALGDEASEPKFIQTVPRQGYRFVAAVDTSGAPPQRDAFLAWTKGRLSLESLNAEQLQETTTTFESVVASNPDHAAALTALANAYFLQYELTRPENAPNAALLARAMTHAERASVLDPSSSEAWATLSLLHTSVGDVDKARATARHATTLRPDSWRHQFRLAMACWGEERLEAVDRTLALKPDFATAHLIGAMVFVARQAFEAAEERAAKGAALQSQSAKADSPFPAFGLHWLLGLLQLRRGASAKARASFDREVSEARRTSIYYREYLVNALVGAGYAHLSAGDTAAAADAFRRALEMLPGNGRALLGLQRALGRSGSTKEAESLAQRVDEALAALTKSGRAAEAAMLGASIDAARGEHERACATLQHMMEQAPRCQIGWMLPIDPALATLRDHAASARTLALLSARAS